MGKKKKPAPRPACVRKVDPGLTRNDTACAVSVFLLLVLALDDLGLADQDRPALELVERLHQREVLVGAVLWHLAVGRTFAGFFLGLLARIVPSPVAGSIFHFGPLAAVQVLVQ